MARGKYYTPEEDRSLLALLEDNPDLQYIELAKLAHRYGICTERGLSALAQHISQLRRQADPETTEEPEPEEMTIETMIAEVKAADKYEDFIDLIFRTMKLHENRMWLLLSFPDIMKWLRENEPTRMAARLKELQFAESRDDVQG